MALLDDIGCPDDVRKLTIEQAEDLADEIRTFLIKNVSRTGGHLGPNLGVVELTIALHRVFDSPYDPIIFDTGHQSYVHKILTGRAAGFDKLRQRGGLSGYPSRAESAHDWVENSHASASLSWAEGMAKGFLSRGEDRTVVAVIGDGALTGGMAWEALDSIADQQDLRLVIVVNDNGRSYTPTVGGLANQLAIIRTDPHYEEALDRMRRHVTDKPLGKQVFGLMHAAKAGVKDALIGNGIFSDLGIKYLGPVDGHDVSSVERALELAKRYEHPVIVHVMTTKGKGFAAAEANEEDHFHAVGQIDPKTGESLKVSGGASWTQAFAGAMVELGERRPDVVGVTAAMLHPVGLAPFAARHPERVVDVGIAEQHAVAAAAGLAAAGIHPIVALYSTFLNRAFDQLLMDAGLHHAGVTIVLDRAGVTGTDGASHNGMWDMAICGIVPGLMLSAPRDRQHLISALNEAVDIDDRPTVIRYSKDLMPDDIPVVSCHDGLDVLRDGPEDGILLVAHGQLCTDAVQAADSLDIPVRVVSPRWSLPVCAGLLEEASKARAIVSVEDGLVVSGLGSHLADALSQRGVWPAMRNLGIPQRYLDHDSRSSIMAELGLTAEGIAEAVTQMASHLDAH
ncbi:1-deoxy-D-xylulose-5-phosphate synthase [Cutibacterium equinum]|uniref:1-deoxy-D-xylulose-5-phosphate synthase n=1 Tax=Cutibacterium equinum TaxID=3016342 RepID=A0ABY7R0G7_9ACTN|nr:1-deoxy-D-xylulose-5-phosphate synthase [Cutibacterium equinum]WCC80788.1 1-deoxy-D-xylulose-5-phosphate synthase [Cutibacterium equinum]